GEGHLRAARRRRELRDEEALIGVLRVRVDVAGAASSGVRAHADDPLRDAVGHEIEPVRGARRAVAARAATPLLERLRHVAGTAPEALRALEVAWTTLEGQRRCGERGHEERDPKECEGPRGGGQEVVPESDGTRQSRTAPRQYQAPSSRVIAESTTVPTIAMGRELSRLSPRSALRATAGLRRGPFFGMHGRHARRSCTNTAGRLGPARGL